MNLIFQFFWSVLTRFAKTFGCIFLIAGIGFALGLYQQTRPVIDALRYQQSNLLTERLNLLQSIYEDAQREAMKFKGSSKFPVEYAAASFVPHFPQHSSNMKDFQTLQGQLAQVADGKEAMKKFVIGHFEDLLNGIQQKLIAHAAFLAPFPLPIPQSSPPPSVTLGPDYGLYDDRIDISQVESRRSTLHDAKEFLGTLESSAEDPENKKKLDDSMAEIDAFADLLPSLGEDVSPPQTATSTAEPSEPLNAEKVAARVAQIRSDVRQAVLSSWALDEVDAQAIHTAEDEQSKFLASEYQVKQFSEELRIKMALAVTAGVVLGVFFMLMGDWTQKSSTELIADPWSQLIENISANPSDVYATIEQCVEARKVPDLEITREFWHEGGAISAQREYLRLTRERLVFEICAAPFGTGFFLSSRTAVIPLVIDPLAIFCFLFLIGAALAALVSLFGLLWGAIILVFSLCVLVFLTRTAVARGLANVDRVLMKTPLIGPLYELFLRHDTYYRLDTRAMYVQAVHNAVSEAFQSMFGDHGINLLSASVTKPVMENIYRKRL
jgi:hypothetical protein